MARFFNHVTRQELEGGDDALQPYPQLDAPRLIDPALKLYVLGSFSASTWYYTSQLRPLDARAEELMRATATAWRLGRA